MNQVDELGALRERAQDLGLLPLVRKITWLRNTLLKGVRIPLLSNKIDKIEKILYMPEEDITPVIPEPTGNVFAAGARMEMNHKLAQSMFEDKELERYRNPSSFGVTVAVPPKPPTLKAKRTQRKKNKRKKVKQVTHTKASCGCNDLAAAFTQIGL